jgi:integrase
MAPAQMRASAAALLSLFVNTVGTGCGAVFVGFLADRLAAHLFQWAPTRAPALAEFLQRARRSWCDRVAREAPHRASAPGHHLHVRRISMVGVALLGGGPALARRSRAAPDPARLSESLYRGVQSNMIFATATPFELGLFGTLSISGPRPGEIYALEWPEVYLDVEKPYFRIARTWCSKGFRFYTPKTEAGRRTVPISAWLAAVLREHRATSGGVGLVFPSTAGTPLNKANVRKGVWMPLLERAPVRYRDIYSLRWTFVSLARASGEAAFNVSRLIGHARSTIVDTIYAHTVRFGTGWSQRERCGACGIDTTHATRAPRTAQRTSPAPAVARHRRRTARAVKISGH